MAAPPTIWPLPRRAGNLHALRHRPLAAYLAGNMVSNCGTWIQNIALAVLVYRLTDGNTFWVGVVGFSQFAAHGLLAPWSGRAAERLDRRQLGMAAGVANAVVGGVLAVVTALGAASVPVACGLALLAGTATAFATPAVKALVTGLTPGDDVGRAVALDSASYNVARVLGPLLGAAVVAGVGLTWAFALNALASLGLTAGLVTARSTETSRWKGDRGGRLRDAVGLVRADPLLLAAFAVVAAVSTASDAVTTLGPELSVEVYDRSDTFAGVLVGAFGLGAIIVVLTSSPALRTTPRRLALRCTAMAVGLVGLALATSSAVGLAALVLAGGGYLAGNTEASTSIQLGVTDADRGRISALWSVAFLGLRPVASLVLGATASVAGARVAAAVATLPLVLAVIALARLRHRAPVEPAAA